ncbi:DUF2249 domain-containing protein [Paenibacillus sp. N3/727]|uniref:DUF2249 domain-containing protein n=1 Tax=Paenibacillus sp. N3/727 TaxID=2925845 RepID=UPI001F5324A0|nr:DUF2249 domain-containing protein [Paenibacillus sp. N3/727]UNK19229.1 DUF2249 domain-containing protein [Paenibacillus sp. N3/727]
MDNPRTIELDVRPHLKNKIEPLQIIMDTVKSLNKNDTFVLHVTFKPTPLLMLMKRKGYQHTVQKAEKDHWIATFVHKSSNLKEAGGIQEKEAAPQMEHSDPTGNGQGEVYFLDNRGLEQPTPMIRTLKQLEKAKSGDKVTIHNDRVPMFLIEELQSLGYAYEIEEQQDGTAVVTIHKT